MNGTQLSAFVEPQAHPVLAPWANGPQDSAQGGTPWVWDDAAFSLKAAL